MTNIELITESIDLINKGMGILAIQRLKHFVALNTNRAKTNGKVKIYDWISKTNDFPVCVTGVYHDVENKIAVATDTYIMLLSKPDYIEQEDGVSKLLNRSGDKISTQYPNYQKVFPKDIEEIDVDIKRIADMCHEMRVERKVDKSVKYVAFNVGPTSKPVYIAPDVCKKILTLPKGTFYVAQGKGYAREAITYISDNGDYKALFMPVYVGDADLGKEMVTK